MYVCKRARPDIAPALSYLCTKVANPTINDQEKLDRLLDFLHGTIDNCRVLGAMFLNEMVTWINASFTIHINKRSHTGGTISFRVGVKKKTIYQDNESTIKMERNGRNFCTGNSRHIDILYFFVHDCVKTGEINVVHCPTERIVADFFTKPLQGQAFHPFRSAIMGYDMKDLISVVEKHKMQN